ncbi:MAG: hypothetical protein AAF843_10175 [Bacteroidota bacterium]
MIIASRHLTYLFPIAFGLLLGIIIGDTGLFINYFFGKYASDSIILLLLAGVSFWLGSLIKNRLKSVLPLFTILCLHLTVGIRYAYELQRVTEWTSTILYALIAILAFLIGWQKAVEKHNRPILSIAVVSGLLLVMLADLSAALIVLVVCFGLLVAQLTSFRSKYMTYYLLVLLPVLTAFFLFSSPPTLYERQKKYFDPLVFSEETSFQTVDITSWKGQEWFYYNNINQFSSIDHWLYFEPMAHIACQLTNQRKNMLVIGGENGLLVHQLLKYQDVESIDIVPVDLELFEMAAQVDHFTQLNKNALLNPRVHQVASTTFDHLSKNDDQYDMIFIDVPDPVDLELNQYYTSELYSLCYKALTNNGILITQAASPYFSTKAFNCIQATVEANNFITLPIHNQVLTLGEWGWIIGFKNTSQANLTSALASTPFNEVETKWLNKEAVNMMMAFGKSTLTVDTVINSLKNPIVHEFYTTGTWKLQ